MAWSEWKKFGAGLENFTWQSGVNSFTATIGKQYYVIISAFYADYEPTLSGCTIDEKITELKYSGSGRLLAYKVTSTSTQIIEKHNNNSNTHVALGYIEI